MNELHALYFDGTSARAQPVRVLVFADRIEVRTESEEAPPLSFLFTALSHNQINEAHYIYLDAKGLQYLLATAGAPIAPLLQAINNNKTGWAQKLMKQKLPVLIATVLALTIGLYYLLISLIPFAGTKLISVEHEIKIGRKLKEVMLQELTLTGAQVDTPGTAQLQAFANALQLSKQYPIQLTLVKSSVVNAFALPGGQVVVYSGIVSKIQSPEALAALLAHESAHINERHSLKSLLRNAANSILISVVFGDVTGLSGAFVANANTINGLHYSRSLEAAADEEGMHLLRQNNVDVKGMLALMGTLKSVGDIPEELSFLSSHPLTSDRMRKAAGYLKRHKQVKRENKHLSFLFSQLQARVKHL